MINFTDDNLIGQSERLFTVRPRSNAISPKDWGGAGNRGTRARFRLLTTNVDRSRRRDVSSFSSPGNASYILSRMVTDSPGFGYTDFLLTNVSVNFNEKVQITQTFGDTETVYYFGKAPIIFNLSGMLIDDLDNQWFTLFVEAYTHILRGSELARNYELVELVLPNMVIIGTIMSFAYQQDAQRDTDIPFTMQMHAKELRPIPVQIPAHALSSGAEVIDFKKAEGFKDFTSIAQINSLKSKMSKLQGLAQNPLSSAKDISDVYKQLGTLGDNVAGRASGVFNSDNFSGLRGLNSEIANTGGVAGDIASGSLVVDPSGFDFAATSNITGSDGRPLGAANLSASLSGSSGGVEANTTSTTAFRASLFSPVFGVLTSITKVVKTTTGDISRIISSFTNPVNTVLRDIQGIAAQAINVVKAVELGIDQIVNQPLKTLNEIRKTITALRNAAGVISRAPETIAQSIKRLVKFGSLKTGAAFLTKGGKAPGGKTALLNSGRAYTAASGSRVR